MEIREFLEAYFSGEEVGMSPALRLMLKGTTG